MSRDRLSGSRGTTSTMHPSDHDSLNATADQLEVQASNLEREAQRLRSAASLIRRTVRVDRQDA